MPVTRSSSKQVKLDEFTDDKNNIRPNDNIASKQKKDASEHAKQKKENQTTTTTKTIPQKRSTQATHHHDDGGNDLGGSEKAEQAKSKKSKSSNSTSMSTNTGINTTGEQQTLSTENINDFEKPIMINRSPVLQLWGAMVAQFTYADGDDNKISWETCLSIGNAISALCAVTKGRAIGVIDLKPKDTSTANNDDDDDNEGEGGGEAENGSAKRDREKMRELSVMGFPMTLKNSIVEINGKSKKLNESTLRSKFGDQGYETVKKAMADGLESWKGDSEELNRKAFHMYEKFRPSVQQGQSGWGRKGELNPHHVTSVIKR